MNEAGETPLIRSAWLFLLLALCLVSEARAQNAPPVHNLVYAEALGNALYGGSVNYERMLAPRFSARLGASPFGSFPVMLNYLPGQGNHAAEVGVGVLLGASDENLLGTGTLGYRYQPREGGMVFRAGWTPLIGAAGVATWAGVSLGFAF